MMNKQQWNRKPKRWSSVLVIIGAISGLAFISDVGFVPVANAQEVPPGPLVFVALDKPCRIVNTRNSSEIYLLASAPRTFLSYGSAGELDAQGGDPNGCEEPYNLNALINPRAIAANITAVGKQATGNGNIVAYAADQSTPSTSSINYTTAANVANHIAIGLDSNGQFNLMSNANNVPAIVDVTGYFYGLDGF